MVRNSFGGFLVDKVAAVQRGGAIQMAEARLGNDQVDRASRRISTAAKSILGGFGHSTFLKLGETRIG
jgi:hypothetical protein